MQRPSSTAQHLQALAAAAHGSADLAGSLNQLLALARRAVPSCAAVSLILDADSIPITVTASTGEGTPLPIRSSLAMRIPRRDTTAHDAPSPRLVLYSTDPGVFDGIARDLTTLLDMHLGQAELDAHLTLPDADAQGEELGARLEDRRSVDMALGILLDRGLLPFEGRAELQRLARQHGITRVEAAQRVVSQARNHPFTDHEPDTID